MASFVDRVVLHVQAGNGGHGCVSILREKFKPLGGPDGGDGGHGGSVRLVVDPGIHTLLDFHFRPHVRAENGKGGAGSNRDGANGGDLVLRVPNGTVVQTARRRGHRRSGRRRHGVRDRPRRPWRPRQRRAGQHPAPGARLRRAGRAG